MDGARNGAGADTRALAELTAAAEEGHRELNRLAGRQVRRVYACYQACVDHRHAVEAHVLDSERPVEQHAVIDPGIQARDELAAALGVTCGRAASLIDRSVELVEQCPAVLAAMGDGLLDDYQSGLIVRRLAGTPEAQRPSLSAVIVADLREELRRSRRFSRRGLESFVDRRVRAFDPDSVARLEDEARKERHVSFTPGTDGMTNMHALLPAKAAKVLAERLDHDARQASPAAAASAGSDSGTDGAGGSARSGLSPFELGTLAEKRADALVALAYAPASAAPTTAPEAATAPAPAPTSSPDAPPVADPAPAPVPVPVPIPEPAAVPISLRPEVTVIVPGSDRDGEVFFRRSGRGSMQMLTDLLAGSDGASFHTVGTSATESPPEVAGTYRIPSQLARRIRQRDGTCRHPGCSVAAQDCDIDHVVPFDHSRPDCGGLTTESNLVCLCRSHHRHKTFGDFTYRLAPDGELTITTASGITVATRPDGPLAHAREPITATASTGDSAPGAAEPSPRPTRRQQRRERQEREQRRLLDERRSQRDHPTRGPEPLPDDPPF